LLGERNEITDEWGRSVLIVSRSSRAEMRNPYETREDARKRCGAALRLEARGGGVRTEGNFQAALRRR